MTVHDAPWPAGTPCWADFTATDLARTQAFYTAVLGWSYTESDPTYMGYCNALVNGHQVAGLSPTPPDMEVQHVWSIYLATDDIAATDAAIKAAGCMEIFPPMQVGPFGHMGLWIDPAGAAFGAWQSLEHTGFELSGEPGAVAWIDLMSADLDRASEFYTDVFGFTYTDMGSPELKYSMFSVPGGEAPAGGMGAAAVGQQSGWSVCFEVDDADAAAERVRVAGGQILQEPWDFEYGRLVGATGPDGETFYLIKSKAAAQAES